MLNEKNIREKLAFSVTGGRVVFDDRQAANELLRSLPDGNYYLTPKRNTPYRNKEQNGRLWRTYSKFAFWCNVHENFTDFTTGMPMDVTPELVHYWCKHKFAHLLPKRSMITPDGELIEMELTTTMLLKYAGEGKQFGDYYEAVIQFIAEYTNHSLEL